METEHEASDEVAAARAQLWRVVSELEDIRYRLLGVHTSLAARFLDSGPQPTEVSAEILAAVECVLIDRISPALLAIREVLREEPPPHKVEDSR